MCLNGFGGYTQIYLSLVSLWSTALGLGPRAAMPHRIHTIGRGYNQDLVPSRCTKPNHNPRSERCEPRKRADLTQVRRSPGTAVGIESYRETNRDAVDVRQFANIQFSDASRCS